MNPLIHIKRAVQAGEPELRAALDNGNFFSLWAFRAATQFKLNVLTFVQSSEAVIRVKNVFEMNENIWALFLFNKAKTFVCVKPFNGAGG
jgi:hypothetical protein